MITAQTLDEILDSLDKDQIEKAYEENKGYVKLEVSIFNSGFSASIESVDYDGREEESVTNAGNLYLDKEHFSMLVQESATKNEVLIKLYS